MFRQVKLRDGEVVLTTNLEEHPKLKVGNTLTLKDSDDPNRLWTIESVSDVGRERTHLNRKWNNNI